LHPDAGLFLAAPLIAGNRLFVAACQSDLGGYTGLLACLDADTGKPIWQFSSLGDDNLKPFFSSPALTADGKYLIVGQGLHQDTDCQLMCFDAATGQLHWAVRTPLHIESSPAIFGDMAVVGAGAIEGRDGLPTGHPGYVFAVRISDGKELWRQNINDPESDPAIDENGTIYIGSGFNGCAVVALRSASDEDLKAQGLPRILWKTPTDFPVAGPITLTDDLVLCGSGNGDVAHSAANPRGIVMALDRKTGAVRWQTNFEDSVLGAVAVRNGLAICPVRSGRVTALSLKDGSIVWQLHISGNAPVLAGCALTDTRVYAVSSDGYLAILTAADGKVLEKIALNDPAKPGTNLSVSSPQISGGRVFVGSETGGLHCFTGTEAQP
jgi:outer membrane protein assembly factor BamB